MHTWAGFSTAKWKVTLTVTTTSEGRVSASKRLPRSDEPLVEH
jgi:hypothetical protein